MSLSPVWSIVLTLRKKKNHKEMKAATYALADEWIRCEIYLYRDTDTHT